MTEEKQCRAECGEVKPLTDFYKHPRMLDGRRNICKECHKARVRANRSKRVEQYREYERSRASLPHRVEARREYAKTERGRAAVRRSQARQRVLHPEKCRARNKLSNAVRDGRVVRPGQCSKCQVECAPHGHHTDYSKPLDVVWLCGDCHREEHRKDPCNTATS